MEKVGGRFLQEFRGGVHKVFMHFPPKFLQKPFPPMMMINFINLALMIVITRCQILRLKCTKFDFSWGSAPDPTGGAYSAPPNPLAGFKGAYF